MAPRSSDAAQSSWALVSAPLPLSSRLALAIKLWFIKGIVTLLLEASRLPGLRNTSILPTFERIYPIQKTLRNRVFVPKSYKSGDALLPLYLNIHGGGFALGQPRQDDRFCSEFSNDNKILVVSLDYPKAPNHPFPAPVIALTDIVRAVLEDESLPFDKSKVAIGGFSAGANLSFAVAQDESLQGKIGGLVSFYGVLDYTIKTSDKLATRPKDAGTDPLDGVGAMFNWGYLNQGQDLKDPLLSVGFAPKEKLPPKLYIVGCELDLLCRESEVMAQKLSTEGTAETETSNSWEKNGIKWEKVLGEQHGMYLVYRLVTYLLTHLGFDSTPTVGAKKIRVEKRRKELFESTAEWLLREVYK